MKEQKKQTIRKNFVYDPNNENPEKHYRTLSEDFSKTKKFNNLFNDEEEKMATNIQPIVDHIPGCGKCAYGEHREMVSLVPSTCAGETPVAGCIVRCVDGILITLLRCCNNA